MLQNYVENLKKSYARSCLRCGANSFNLRMQQGINPDGVRSDRITSVRKDIARVKTVMNENRGGKEA